MLPEACDTGAARRRSAVSIAMNLIATKGFEGLRFQELAKEAGINNATLSYYFPTKEALIQGVVTRMTGDLKLERVHPKEPPTNALAELRMELEGVRQLLREAPTLFIVLTELALRSRRDPVLRTQRSA
jgi:TetR/AcrR family transcriptional regulator, regulator of cefoperazone and chloramphenicol sensitivity